mgnify:CR=1 FL=1
MTLNRNKILIVSLIFFILAAFTIGCTGIGKRMGWSDGGLGKRKMAQFLLTTRPFFERPDSHYLLACYYQERGRYRDALNEFRKVLVIDPNYIKAYNGMGVCYDLLGDFQKAIESYQMALNLDPNLDYVYNNLGYSYFLQGNMEEAIEAFKKAISLNNRNPRFHNNLGLAYAEKGEYELALSEFKLASDEFKAHYYMAQIYFKKNLFEKAKDHYGKVLTLNPAFTIAQTSLDATNALARIFGQSRKQEEPKQFILPESPQELVSQAETLKVEDPGAKEVDLVISEKLLSEEVEKKGLISLNNA